MGVVATYTGEIGMIVGQIITTVSEIVGFV